MNGEYERLTGFAPGEVIGRTPGELGIWSAPRDFRGIRRELGRRRIVRNITQRKRNEAAIRELSGRLLQLQDRERRRIALELHDSTAQTLAALAMNLARVKKSEDALDAAIELADQSSQEIRSRRMRMSGGGASPGVEGAGAGWKPRS